MPLSPPSIRSSYDQNDFEILGFHDCHVTNIKANAEKYEMVLFLDYIVQWVKPDQEGGPFKFWICPATLTFKNCAEIELNLKWSYFHLDLQIEELIRRESRLTPNRIPETNWVLEFNEPSGYFSFWATDFELKILSPPILSETMTIR